MYFLLFICKSCLLKALISCSTNVISLRSIYGAEDTLEKEPFCWLTHSYVIVLENSSLDDVYVLLQNVSLYKFFFFPITLMKLKGCRVVWCYL